MWYSFRRRKYPIVVPIVYYFTPYNKKTIGSDFFYFHILEKGWNYEFIWEKDMEVAAEYLLKNLLKDRNYIHGRLLKSRELGEKFISFCKNNLARKLGGKTDKQLLELLSQFRIFYEKFSLVNVTPWLFLGDRLSSFLAEKIRGFAKNSVNDVLILLSTPNSRSYTKKEELDVLASAVKIKEGESNIKTEAKKLAKKYFWIPFDYVGPELWDEKHYADRISALLRAEASIIKKEIGENKIAQKQLATDQRNQINKLNLPENIVARFEAMKEIAVLQDEKKAITTECHYYLQNLYKEIGGRTNNDYRDFYLLLNEELRSVMKNKINVKKLAEERIDFSVVMLKNGKVKIIKEREARKFIKKAGVSLPSEERTEGMKEVKGISASAGKMRGTIRVLLSARELDKINQGEVLVATMTTPDYVPAMKKAAAVITDEGGITCHAAIVSRELGIPCIIGTKIATKVFKDGDLVEVDADKGVVKIIKKAK